MTNARKTKRRSQNKLPIYSAPIIIQLKEARLRKNISQAELEHKIGLAEGYLSKWETGERRPNLFNLICWADALGVNISIIPNQELASNDNSRID